jgi:very-short-patch-repair endonuclease
MKQVQGVQFFRQRPIGNHIVDFFAPKAGLIVEADVSQHVTDRMARRDKQRDDYLTHLGLLVLRFPDSDVLRETEGVMEVIFRRVSERCIQKSPPTPL